jgi:hypothetical protein
MACQIHGHGSQNIGLGVPHDPWVYRKRVSAVTGLGWVVELAHPIQETDQNNPAIALQSFLNKTVRKRFTLSIGQEILGKVAVSMNKIIKDA